MLNMFRPRSITVVRHAEYWWDIAYQNDLRFKDVSHVPKQIIGVEEQHVGLTPAGVEQAIATSKGLAEMQPNGFDAIFYSPWDRVIQTIELLLSGWESSPRVLKRMKRYCKESHALAERYQGDGVQWLDKGRPETWNMQFERLRLLLELKHRDYTKFRRKGLQTGDPAIDGPTHTGESHWQVVRRLDGFLQRIFTRHYHDKDVMVIGHLASIMWLRRSLEHLTAKQTIEDLNREDKAFAISNCGVSRYEWSKDLPTHDGWQRKYWNRTFYEEAYLET